MEPDIKGERIKLKYHNHSGVLSQSISYKIPIKTLNSWVQRFAIDVISEKQSGLRKGRLTVFDLFVLKQILEKCCKFKRSKENWTMN